MGAVYKGCMTIRFKMVLFYLIKVRGLAVADDIHQQCRYLKVGFK